MKDNEQMDKINESTIDDNIQVRESNLEHVSDEDYHLSSKVEFIEWTSQELKKQTRIRGWLTFFLIWVGLGGVLSFINIIVTSSFDINDPIFFVASLCDTLYILFYLLISLYVIYLFLKRKSNAVFVAKAYLIYHICINIVTLCMGDFEESGLGSLNHTINSMIWNIIWFIYIIVSKQVNTIIPKTYRKYQKINTWMIVWMVLIPLIAYVGAFSFAYNYYQEPIEQGYENNRIDEFMIGEHEYTDGKIIFSCPMGMNCESQYVDESLKIYQLSEENRLITVLSDYDNNCSLDNFIEYWKTGRDNILGNYQWSIIKDEIDTLTVDKIYYYRVVQSNVDEAMVYWQYVMLFDKNTDKVAIISAYDNDGDDSYVLDLLHSMRFEN